MNLSFISDNLNTLNSLSTNVASLCIEGNKLLEDSKNLDLNNPKTLLELSRHPNCELLLNTLKNNGYINETQFDSIHAKIKLCQKTSQAFEDLHNDLQALRETKTLHIFMEGEKQMTAKSPIRRLKLFAKVGACAFGAIGAITAIYYANPIAFLGSLVPITWGAKQLVIHAKQSIVEGYYYKARELATKNFKNILGKENVEKLISKELSTSKPEASEAIEKYIKAALHIGTDLYLRSAGVPI